MSQVTYSESILNPVCAKLRKMSSRKFKFNTEISTPKLAFRFLLLHSSSFILSFFFFSSAILFLCCGHNSDVAVKNISVLDLPFFRKTFITVSQLGHARYYHRDPQTLRRTTSRNSFLSRKNSCIIFWSIGLYFIFCALSFLYLVCTQLAKWSSFLHLSFSTSLFITWLCHLWSWKTVVFVIFFQGEIVFCFVLGFLLFF